MASDQMIAPEAGTAETSDRRDVFVSYSRQDKAFVKDRLLPLLAAARKGVWIDLEDIPPAADWRDRIEDGIQAAPAFVFVLSPDSVVSEVCEHELRQAVDGNKRLIPVLRRDVAGVVVPEELERPNWILLRDEDDFDAESKRLIDAIEVDFEWVDTHARLAVAAREWERAGEDRSLLLRGSRIAAAEEWLSRQGGHDEAPTPEHSRYIVASRQAATRRLGTTLVAVATALVVSIGLGIFAVLQTREARDQRTQAQEQRDRALSLALAANSADNVGVDPELALLLATEALEQGETTQASAALRGALRAARWRKIIRPPGGDLAAADLGGDGRLVVTANGGRAAALWNAATGRPLRTLRGHRAAVVSAELSSDGARVVTTAADGSARIWQARSGRLLAAIPGDRDRRPSDDFSPFADFAAGDTLVYAVGRRVTRLWDLRAGRVVAELRVPGPPFGVDVDVSSDGRLVATTRELDERTQVWDVSTGRVTHTLRGDNGFTARFSPDGRRLVTGDPGHVWDTASGRHIRALAAGARIDVDFASFSPSGTRIVGIFLDDAYVLDASTGKALARLRGHSDYVNTATFSPDGKHVLTASADGTARVWDASTGRSVEVLRGHTRALAAAEYSLDGRDIVTLSEDDTVRVWDAARGGLELRPPAGAEDAEFSPDGRLVVPSGSEAPFLPIWDAATGAVVRTLKVGDDTFSTATFGPGGDILVTDHDGERIRVWSTRTWTDVAVKPYHDRDDLVQSVVLSRDGRRLLTTSFDGVVTVSDVSSGEPLGEFSAPDVEDAAFGRDGTEVVAVWADVKSVGTTDYYRGRVGSWKLPDGTEQRLWHGDERSLSDLEASRDGRFLLASGPENAVVLDAETGKRVATITEPQSESGLLGAAHFSNDATRVITADDDNLARIWDARTGKHVLDLDGHAGSVNDARFSPDGHFAVTISSDGTSRIWDARTGAQVEVVSGLARGLVQTARFSPDGARVVTADGVTVRINRCELCVPVKRQLAFARSLVARQLSAAERRAAGLT